MLNIKTIDAFFPIETEFIEFSKEDGSEAVAAIDMYVKLQDKKFVVLAEVTLVDDLIVPVDNLILLVARIITSSDGTRMLTKPTDEEFNSVLKTIEEFKETPE